MAHFVASNATRMSFSKPAEPASTTSPTLIQIKTLPSGAEPGLGARESRWQGCGLSLQLPTL
jgi:hypothetical protein